MARLRRLALSDRFSFAACKLVPSRKILANPSSRCWRSCHSIEHTVKEHHEKVECIHLNPVKRGPGEGGRHKVMLASDLAELYV